MKPAMKTMKKMAMDKKPMKMEKMMEEKKEMKNDMAKPMAKPMKLETYKFPAKAVPKAAKKK